MKLSIDRKELLRYLGHRPGQSLDGLEPLLEEACRIVLEAADPRYVSRSFSMERTEAGIALTGTTLVLPGRSIAAHLRRASRCILMAATLGPAAEREIRRAGYRDMALSVVLDAAATCAAEDLCDRAEAELRARAEAQGETVTGRFSPGYGDLPLEIQNRFLAVLDAERTIGLHATPEHLLVPGKSVTAVLGIVPRTAPRDPSGCAACDQNKTCAYRKGGTGHENTSLR